MAVAASALGEDNPHPFRRKLQELGQRVAQAEDALAGTPDRRLVRAHVGDGAGRTDGAVHLEGPLVRRADGLRRVAEGDRDVADVRQRLVGRARGTERPVELAHLGQGRGLAPRHPECLGGVDRLLLALADDADEVGHPHGLNDAR